MSHVTPNQTVHRSSGGDRREAAIAPCRGDYARVSVRGALFRRAKTARSPGFVLEAPAFDFYPGERIGVVGPSGSGKSTLLDFMSLILAPTALSSAFFVEESPTHGAIKRDLTQDLLSARYDRLAKLRSRAIGYATQGGGLLPFLTVEQNIGLGARLAGVPSALVQSMIADYAERVGLADLLRRRPDALSGGERQRAAVLRSVLSGALVLIADEPTAALDDEVAEDVMTMLTEFAAERNMLVICASHNHTMLRRHGFTLWRVRPKRDSDGVRRSVFSAPAAESEAAPDE